MDVTPQLLREVEFREQRKGYDQKEVDDFLERVAVAFGQQRSQLDEAIQRAERAERRVLDGPADEEELRRTLVLATRTAEATREDARQSAAATLSAAEERAAATIRDAEAHAASVVAEAEARVQEELHPLLGQRDAVARDVEALQAWATEVRRRLADEMRRQLAALEGGHTALPARPELTTVALPTEVAADDVATVPDEPRGEAGAGPYRVADGWDPTPPDVRVGEHPPSGDDTAAFDTLDASGATRAGTTDGPAGGGATAGETVATPDEGDDPFLTELRRAVDDDEPLGPRDGGAEPREEPGAAPTASGPGAGDDADPSFWRRQQEG